MRTREIILIIIIIGFTAGPLYSQYNSTLKLNNEISFMKNSAKNTKDLSYKSPALAGCLSFFVPGAALGQIYNEKYEKFALHFGISAAIFSFTIIAKETKLYELSTMNIGGGPGKEGKKEWIFVLCVLAYTGNWLWSTIDAIHSATMNNRELEQKRARLEGRTQKSTAYYFGFGLDKNNNLNLQTVIFFR